MNANELADELCFADMDSDELETWAKEAATLLRQQQAEIEALKDKVNYWIAVADKERIRADRNEQ